MRSAVVAFGFVYLRPLADGCGRVIRSVEANQGALSNVLAMEMPVLSEPGVRDAIVEAVRRSGMIS